MIPVNLHLVNYEGWSVHPYNGLERNFLSVPRKGEIIKYDGHQYKVHEVTYELDDGVLAPIIRVIAKEHFS